MLEIEDKKDCPVCGLFGCDYLIGDNWVIVHIPLPENEFRIEKVVIAPGKAKIERTRRCENGYAGICPKV